MRFFSIALAILLLFYTQQLQAAYITKKSDTSKIVIKIENDYADGKISKAECNKKKSKALKLEKVSKTICDNVEVINEKKEELIKLERMKEIKPCYNPLRHYLSLVFYPFVIINFEE